MEFTGSEVWYLPNLLIGLWPLQIEFAVCYTSNKIVFQTCCFTRGNVVAFINAPEVNEIFHIIFSRLLHPTNICTMLFNFLQILQFLFSHHCSPHFTQYILKHHKAHIPKLLRFFHTALRKTGF